MRQRATRRRCAPIADGGAHTAILTKAVVLAMLVAGATGAAESWTVTTIAGNGTEGYADGATADTTKFAFLDPKSQPTVWLIGVTVMEDDTTVVLIDNYNQAIRTIDLRTRETTTLVETKEPCEPNKCQCQTDLTADCGDVRRHSKAMQLSGIVGFRSTVYYSNRWNEVERDTSNPAIYMLNLNDNVIRPVRISHTTPTTNITFAPHGLAKGPTNIEVVFTNYGASICMLNTVTGVVKYLAGPALRGLPGEIQGYQDGFGAEVQVASPMGITTDTAQQYSYFVDSVLCNVRRLDLSSFEVTTLVGPRSKLRGSFQCGYADGVGEAIRFTLPSGIAAMAGNRLAVTDIRDQLVRIVDLEDLSSKTIAGLRSVSGWVDGNIPSIIRMNVPSGIAVTSNGGTLVVIDQGSNRVRVMDKECSPFFIVVAGKCVPCNSIACGLGWYRSVCRFDQTDGLCRKCPYQLPIKATWDTNQPNCTWTCEEGYIKTELIGIGGTQECEEGPGRKGKELQLSDQVLIGIIIASALVVICCTLSFTWFFWNKRLWKKRQALVEVTDMTRIQKIIVDVPEIEMGVGVETHERSALSPLLKQSSVVRKGSAMAMHAMGSTRYVGWGGGGDMSSSDTSWTSQKHHDPLAEAMEELGFSSESLDRFGARSFGTQEESVAV